MTVLEPRTESPIEERFHTALGERLAAEGDRKITVQTQVDMDPLPYRADFLLTELMPVGFAGFPRTIVVQMVVECDGHDWHDRTKEQAARDRQRDRQLLIAGYPTLRFTGSELHHDVERCIEDTLAALTSLATVQAWGEVHVA